MIIEITNIQDGVIQITNLDQDFAHSQILKYLNKQFIDGFDQIIGHRII